MLRCASSFPRLRGGRLAAYIGVRLIPQDSRALPEPAPAKAGGAFYGAVEFGLFFDFLQVHQLWNPLAFKNP